MPENTKSDALEKLAELIAADLLADGEYLHIITKKGKHTGTWFKSNLTNCLSKLLHQNIELNPQQKTQST